MEHSELVKSGVSPTEIQSHLRDSKLISTTIRISCASQLGKGDRIFVAVSAFSMYTYRELAEQLEGLNKFRLIFTPDAFTASGPKKKRREFYIPRFSREQGLFGMQFEINRKNELFAQLKAKKPA